MAAGSNSSLMSIPRQEPATGVFKIVAPDGKFLIIPQELWVAMQSFQASPTRPSGRVTVHYKDGNIAGVDGETKKVFK